MKKRYKLIAENLNTTRSLLFVHEGDLYGASGSYVQKSTDNGDTFSTFCVVPHNINASKGMMTREGVLVIQGGVPDTGGKHYLITSRDNGITWSEPFEMPMQHLLHQEMAQDSNGHIYVGEYIGGSLTSPIVNLYKSEDLGLTWFAVYTFENSEVRHVHTVREDPYTGYIWMGTGDGGTKNKLGYSTDGGYTFNWLAPTNIENYLDKQVLRVCSLIFTEEYVHWAGDFYPSSFCRYDRNTGIVEELNTFESGPAYYGSKFTNKENVVLIYGVHSPTNATVYISHDQEYWYMAASWDNIVVGDMSRVNDMSLMDNDGYIYTRVANIKANGEDVLLSLFRLSIVEEDLETIGKGKIIELQDKKINI